jgi:hypothetical protein
MSFIEHLQAVRLATKSSDRWTPALRKIRTQIGHDGVERIATETIFERLEVPPIKRTPEAAKRLRPLMVELGWTPVRSRHVTSRGRAARVRGYARTRAPIES